MFKALLVNEAPSHAHLVRSALADAGCIDIESAGEGREVRALIYQGDALPDVILVELEAADCELAETLVNSFRDVPVLAVCAETAIDAAFRAGVADAVTRPLRPIELVARIREALQVRHDVQKRATRERRMSDAMLQLQREKQDLERLVCVDSLTGIANRRHALALLDAEWRRSVRDRSPLGLVMIDLDCYHAYNERYGHLGGDACLQRVTEAMVTCLRRPSDFLGRYGGEEFTAVLPNTDAAGTKIVAERLRSAVETLAIPHDASACAKVVTITAGFASFKALTDLSVDKLIATADAALLRAKVAGRNRVEGDAPLVRQMVRVSAKQWQRFQPVFTDPWFADRIPLFLAETRDEAGEICVALRAGDFGRVRTSARLLAAGAIEFGFSEIGRLAAMLEQASAVLDREAIRHIAEELVQYVTHVQVVYRRPQESRAAG